MDKRTGLIAGDIIDQVSDDPAADFDKLPEIM